MAILREADSFVTSGPKGLFSFWENNPRNPGTRYVMSRIHFNRDAIALSCIEAHRMVKVGGFEALRCNFLFYFPRSLRFFRWAEFLLTHLPLGAQYQILRSRPKDDRVRGLGTTMKHLTAFERAWSCVRFARRFFQTGNDTSLACEPLGKKSAILCLDFFFLPAYQDVLIGRAL